MSFVPVMLLAAILLALAMVSFGLRPRFVSRILGITFFAATISGLLYYGYGYTVLNGPGLSAAIQTLLSVFHMFLGGNELDAVASVPLLSSKPIQLLMQVVHLAAYYVTAGAILTTLGEKLIRILQNLFVPFRRIFLIYGFNSNSQSFAEKLQKETKGAVVLIPEDALEDADKEKVLTLGAVLFDRDDDREPDASLLRRLGIRPGGKDLAVYALSEDTSANLTFAMKLQDVLQKGGIQPKQTRLTLVTEENDVAVKLPAFGSVVSRAPEDLVSRLMVLKYPPCNELTFDETGRAKEDFEALIVGFGRTGQAALRRLLMNGQFAGNRFRATVISTDVHKQAGLFFARYPELETHYDLSFIDDNGRSIQSYQFLSERLGTLKYIVISTGDDAENREIAQEYGKYLRESGCKARILQCSHAGVTCWENASTPSETASPWTPEILCTQTLDAMASVINHQYHLSEGHTAEEDWAACDPFSRESCRASADYTPAFIRASGVPEADLAAKGWPNGRDDLLWTLSEMEHARWCAFHFCMGYRAMTKETFADRAALYCRQKEAGESSLIRVAKDTAGKQHACLIPWDELAELNQREYALTGRVVDYLAMDLDNIRMIPDMLRLEQKNSDK